MARVLLVEDFADSREYFAQILQVHGHQVIEAADGNEALSLACDQSPDVILMDLSLPTLDGWQAASHLKAEPKTCRIPVIALTAHALSGDEQRAREAGCDDYVAKPVLPRELVDRVAYHLNTRVSA